MSPEAVHRELSRRHFLSRAGTGIGAAALATLLNPKLLSAAQGPHFAPKAKRLIWLTQAGAPSQLDLLDYKPGLAARFDQELPDSVRNGQRLTGMTAGQKRFPIAPSVFKFQQHGQSGMWLSELLPHTGKIVDDICIIRSLPRRPSITTRLTLPRPATRSAGGPRSARGSHGLGSRTRTRRPSSP